MTADPIRDVSGTAYWIAQNRAMETASPYPLFRDPWAAQLAGTRGEAITRQLGRAKFNSWVMVTRTVLLDQFVVEGVAEHGFDTVMNLGAGLDTRAYRLPLPRSLRWFDVDVPEIIAHKRTVLSQAEPRCQYQTISADLSIESVRRHTIAQVAAGAQRALVITEGLLEYLTAEAVQTLARELHQPGAFRVWLCNLMTKTAVARIPKVARTLARANAPLLFTPEASTEFFEQVGWRETACASLVDRAMALGRVPGLLRPSFHLVRYAPNETRERIARMLCVCRFERK